MDLEEIERMEAAQLRELEEKAETIAAKRHIAAVIGVLCEYKKLELNYGQD